MIRRPPRSTRTDTRFPYTTRFRSVVAHLVELTGGGADYTFDCTGNTTVMRQALEACHRGWGESIVIGVAEAGRSEEHTSELQSLMRISYAVFCLKKKSNTY